MILVRSIAHHTIRDAVFFDVSGAPLPICRAEAAAVAPLFDGAHVVRRAADTLGDGVVRERAATQESSDLICFAWHVALPVCRSASRQVILDD